MKHTGTRSMIRLCLALLFALVLALPGASSAWADELYNVTIADGIQNGSVTASVNGISVTQAAEGDTVTLLATPTDGYVFDSFIVKQGETDIQVTNNTFTMPAADVTVTATFISEWEALRRAIDRAGENAVIDVSNYDANHDGWIVCPAGENALSITGKSVTLDLHGCVLDRHLTSANESGCVIRVVSGGLQSRLTLTGSDPGNGRTVTIAGKSVEVKGGIITGGKNTYDGGGVFNEGGTFTLSGSASIIGNEARYGGGVFNYYGGEFSMSDSASVTGNTAGERGGGVHNENTFKVSDGAKVTGNKVGTADNNVYLTRDKTITVTGTLSVTTPIGVTMQTPGVFTSGWAAKMSTADPADYFTSDDADYALRLDTEGELTLKKLYNVTIADGIQNGSVTASVNGTSVAQAAEGDTVTLLATPTDGYALNGLTYTYTPRRRGGDHHRRTGRCKRRVQLHHARGRRERDGGVLPVEMAAKRAGEGRHSHPDQ